MSNPSVVTRYAPSPTGYQHVGGARTALFSWLLARHEGANGRFLLRIEDTDQARSTEQAATQMLEDLRWLGLHWDNEQLVVQSKRLEVYNRIIADMIPRGLAYKAWETPQELEAIRKEAEKHKWSFLYRRPKLTDEQVRQYESENRPHVVRFAMPVKDYTFTDKILGKIDLPANQVQDFIIRKTDGMPTFHFAVVVDDQEMGVTHVVRGQEHTLNTFLHIALQDALGYGRPVYAHLPVILNKDDGKKMGKRDRDKKIRQQAQNWLKNTKKSIAELAAGASLAPSRLETWINDSSTQLDLGEQKQVMSFVGLKETDLPEILVHDFRKNGYLPEVLLNFLSLLGWSPGGDRERMTIDEITKLFSLEGIHKAGARFDREKLLAFNTEASAKLPQDRLVKAMRQYLAVNPQSALNRATDEQLAKLMQMKAGFRIFRDVDEATAFLFMEDDQVVYDPHAIEKVMRKQNGIEILREMQPRLEAVMDWKAEPIEKVIEAYCQDKQLGLGKVAQPIRVAVSGGTISPPIFQSLEFLGKAHTITRIAKAARASSP